VAAEEARAVGADLLLGDRDVRVTLRRLSEALGKSDLSKVSDGRVTDEGHGVCGGLWGQAGGSWG
jgi:pheromone shutdown protein TraB